jgi:hypothetical protein
LIAPFFNRQGAVFQGTGEAVCQFGGNDQLSPPTAAPTEMVSLAPTAEEPLFFDFECGTFAVIAGTAITFAGSATSDGDVGSGTDITGIYSIVGGEVTDTLVDVPLLGDTIMDALDAALEIRVDTTASASERGSLTFIARTYRMGIITIVDGAPVILDGQNDLNSFFLFQSVASMLTKSLQALPMTLADSSKRAHFCRGLGRFKIKQELDNCQEFQMFKFDIRSFLLGYVHHFRKRIQSPFVSRISPSTESTKVIQYEEARLWKRECRP